MSIFDPLIYKLHYPLIPETVKAVMSLPYSEYPHLCFEEWQIKKLNREDNLDGIQRQMVEIEKLANEKRISIDFIALDKDIAIKHIIRNDRLYKITDTTDSLSRLLHLLKNPHVKSPEVYSHIFELVEQNPDDDILLACIPKEFITNNVLEKCLLNPNSNLYEKFSYDGFAADVEHCFSPITFSKKDYVWDDFKEANESYRMLRGKVFVPMQNHIEIFRRIIQLRLIPEEDAYSIGERWFKTINKVCKSLPTTSIPLDAAIESMLITDVNALRNQVGYLPKEIKEAYMTPEKQEKEDYERYHKEAVKYGFQ